MPTNKLMPEFGAKSWGCVEYDDSSVDWGYTQLYPAIGPIHRSNIPLHPRLKAPPFSRPRGACALSLGASPSRTRAEKTSPNHRLEAQQRDLRMWFSSKKSQKAWNILYWMVVCKICLKVSYYTDTWCWSRTKEKVVGSRIAFDILWYCRVQSNLAVGQNLVPLVNIKIAGKWMFIPLKMVLIGIDP